MEAVAKIMNNSFNGWSYVSNHSSHPGGRILVLWNPNKASINVLAPR